MARAILPAQQNAGLQVKGELSLAWPRHWQYQPEGSRDIRLDFLRGFCLFVIIANHISFYPAFTIFITGGGAFLISAAEGFIFISGLVMGVVYGPRIVKEGMQAATGKILHRAWQLYLWNFIIAVIFLAIAYFTPLRTQHGEQNVPVLSLDLLIKMLTLRQSFGWSDLLATYAVLVGITPIFFYFLLQKKTWLILGLSWAFWLGYQVSPHNFSPQIGVFPIFAWQILFVHGLIIGYHREAIKEFFAKWPKWTLYLPLVAAFVGLLVLGISWVYMGAFANDPSVNWVLEVLFSKPALAPGRLFAFAVFFLVLHLALTYCWQPLNKALGWLLNPLGQNSLYVYVLHGFAVTVFLNIPNYGNASALVHTLGHISAIVFLWLLVKSKFMFSVVPR